MSAKSVWWIVVLFEIVREKLMAQTGGDPQIEVILSPWCFDRVLRDFEGSGINEFKPTCSSKADNSGIFFELDGIKFWRRDNNA